MMSSTPEPVIAENKALRARVAELEDEKAKLIGYGEVLGLKVRQAEARVAELEALLALYSALAETHHDKKDEQYVTVTLQVGVLRQARAAFAKGRAQG